ncbi:transient receptor potential channel pyrexia [Wyeomyia smithii]|uniref:transient receptor potential channel pyrexia n=1 Tax=Wyeomyia smithii TaxID=174621 RepID=UPI0024680AAC|nr:transient receptor potential channel pyrexia [Wyeomyia smithii]XP_055528368.1 transient receptor potential channel pyrexia [Wyeomyia smithii]XP_055528369.1 transient receptor potential channel pyrexia [Wyeomyia smithii]XP_055528370.1 transient receptor potential channel pyrexia [Wyeomyia smithii]XP_055528371.1 transient receptor potential channel pyrexia [Wyeomyia smithii]XP_055528372.1 transient receptor potential channel pyrexia [Wyeomyia smithii]XP_055528373.1 transient receptor potenti
MQNFGYKEGPIKSKLQRATRATSVVENGILPLMMTSKLKTLSVGGNVRWRNDPEAIAGGALPGADFEYMQVGPSPPAEGAPNLYDSFEEPSPDATICICSETIRSSLMEQLRSASGRTILLEDIDSGATKECNVRAIYADASIVEKNISFLWSAYLNRVDLLEGLIDCGSELMYYDSNGLTALHLSAFSGGIDCTNFLIKKGVEVNVQPKCFTPLHCAALGNSVETAKILINNGANLNIPTNKQNSEESLLHCAVRSNALECVKVFIAEGIDVNMLDKNGTNPIHLAADLGHIQCLQALLDCPKADPNMRVQARDKETTALHLAADEGYLECVTLLLSKGADVKVKNYRGFTALHLAARAASVECVEVLLRMGNADPNAEDADHRTPLHAGVSKSDTSFDILEILISWGANVNHKDVYGFTALHLAALDGLAHCVEMLLFHGADVTTKSKKGTSALNVIMRKTPASLAMINHKLDAAITLTHSQDSSNREVELELDFRSILQHCHPREISYLNTFVDEGQKEILQHPLCSAFLYIKWGKIRKYYIARLLFCFTFVLFLTLYVLTALAHNCYNGSKDMKETIQEQELCQKQSILGDMLRNNPFVMEMQWMVLVAITIVEICRKIYGMTGYTSFRRYVTQAENAIEWFIIVSVFVISYIYTKRTYTWQNHIGAFAVLLGWTNLMLMIGQLPVFGAYVAMYRKVQVEFAKLFMAYSCMLIGFTISFCVIFPSSSSFANPFMGFITVLVMMTGEQDLELLINDPDGKDPPFLLEISAQITFVLFLLFVTVILMNLLIGIAVHDIQGLKKTAGLSKLVRQTKLISYIESALFNGWLPNWLRSLLHYTALVSPQAYRVVLSVKPLNPGEKRLPRDIMMAAYEVAKLRKHLGHTISNRNTNATFFNFKNKLEPTSTSAMTMDRSGDSDCGFETASICTLTTKIDENAEKIERLKNEIRDLKTTLLQNQHVLEQLLDILTANNSQKYRNAAEKSNKIKNDE